MTRTPRPKPAPAAEPPRWLDDEQQDCWRAFNEATVRLRWALEDQLQCDAGLSFIEYHALASGYASSSRTRGMTWVP